MAVFTAESFGRDAWNKFSFAFLLSNFLLFAWPVFTVWSLAFDDSIVYWFGSFLFWWSLPIPFFFLVIYAAHVLLRPHKSLIMGTMIIPCVTLFLLGGALQAKGGHLADKLRNRDCGTFPLIRKLELSLADAKEKYNECLAGATAQSHPHILFTNCNQYEKWLEEGDNAKDWPYLMYLEAQFECTGFCQPDEPLWVYHKDAGTDPCGSALALYLEGKVLTNAKQLMVFPILLVFVTVAWVYSVRPSIAELKHEKKAREAIYGPEQPDPGLVEKLMGGGNKQQSKSMFLPSMPFQQAPPQAASAPPVMYQQTLGPPLR